MNDESDKGKRAGPVVRFAWGFAGVIAMMTPGALFVLVVAPCH